MLRDIKWINKMIEEEITTYIWRNLAKGKTYHMCLHCSFIFKHKSKHHHFCSRACYSNFHRIPGFIRRIVNQKD